MKVTCRLGASRPPCTLCPLPLQHHREQDGDMGTCCEKRDKRTKLGSLMLSPTFPNQDLIPNLIAVSASPSNGIWNPSVWNHLFGTSEVICLTDPYRYLKKGGLATPIHSVFVQLPCPALSCLEVFYFVQLLSAPFYLLDGMMPNSRTIK